MQFKRIAALEVSASPLLHGESCRTARVFFLLWCRYADSSSHPNVDTSNQVTNEQVTRENGQLRVSFTIPCRSTDTRDVPYEGLHYLLFATGAVVGDDITYHGNTRWHTDGPLQLTCGGGYWREFLLETFFVLFIEMMSYQTGVPVCVASYIHVCTRQITLAKFLPTQFSSSTEMLLSSTTLTWEHVEENFPFWSEVLRTSRNVFFKPKFCRTFFLEIQNCVQSCSTSQVREGDQEDPLPTVSCTEIFSWSKIVLFVHNQLFLKQFERLLPACELHEPHERWCEQARVSFVWWSTISCKTWSNAIHWSAPCDREQPMHANRWLSTGICATCYQKKKWIENRCWKATHNWSFLTVLVCLW